MPPRQTPPETSADGRPAAEPPAGKAVYAIANSVIGGDGGTLIINLAAELAASGHRVIIVNAGSEVTDKVLTDGLDVVGPTLSDVLAANASIEDAIRPGLARIDVLPMGVDGQTEIVRRDIEGVLRQLRESYDIVLVQADGLLRQDGFPSDVFDGVVIGTFPQSHAIRRTAEIKDQVHPAEIVAVVVLFGPTDEAWDVNDFVAELGTKVNAHVPNNDVVWESMISGEPVPRGPSGGEAAAAFGAVAESLLPLKCCT